MSNADENLEDGDSPGRGMIGISMDDDGVVQLEHQDTHKTFEFGRDDLDEVIGMLSMFRMTLEVQEDGEDVAE